MVLQTLPNCIAQHTFAFDAFTSLENKSRIGRSCVLENKSHHISHIGAAHITHRSIANVSIVNVNVYLDNFSPVRRKTQRKLDSDQSVEFGSRLVSDHSGESGSCLLNQESS